MGEHEWLPEPILSTSLVGGAPVATYRVRIKHGDKLLAERPAVGSFLRTGHHRQKLGLVQVDGISYAERDYADVPSASHAIAQIPRQQGERSADVDEDACEECDQGLDLMVRSQCGVDAFVRTCDHDGGSRAIRTLDGAAFCRVCRPDRLRSSGWLRS